jgi:hypothetical protein
MIFHPAKGAYLFCKPRMHAKTLNGLSLPATLCVGMLVAMATAIVGGFEESALLEFSDSAEYKP